MRVYRGANLVGMSLLLLIYLKKK